MRVVLWLLAVSNLLLVGYLVYHFALAERHIPAASPPAALYADSILLYEARLDSADVQADELRDRLGRIGKSEWPEVHSRLEALDAEIAALRELVRRWKAGPAEDQADVYHLALASYGRVSGLYLGLAYDTVPVRHGRREE
jgi:hypothetical protein